MNTNLAYTLERITQAFELAGQSGPQTKYIQLYNAIKSCIQNKALSNDWVVPSTRQMADALQLSRTTVIKAYELLLLERLVVSRAGSGYRVRMAPQAPLADEAASPSNAEHYPPISARGRAFLQNISILNRQPDTGIAFKPGLPPIDIFPINQWRKLLNMYWRYVKSSDLSYESSSGSNYLKEQIAAYLKISRNIHCDPRQVVVVSGSLQSIYLIAGAMIDPGDRVALEDPTFPNVHSIFKSNLAELLPLPLDAEGIDLKQLEAAAAHKPKLLHLTPSDHYPLGLKMSLQRRLDVLNWANQHKVLLIENDYEHEMANLKQSLPALFSLDKEDRSFYLGTFNRLLYPSIRLGFMVAPKRFVNVIEALQEHSHRFVSPLVQMVMGQFIERNYLFQHLKNLAEVAQERAEIFQKQFEDPAAALRLQQTPFNSLHMTGLFKQPVSVEQERAFVALLAKHEISAYPLSKCYIQEPAQSGLIMGYSTVRPAVIVQKARQMLNLLHS